MRDTGGERRISRRVLLSAAALSSAALASGCAGAGTQLRYWSLFTGGDGDTMKRMLADYRATHPGVGLEDVTLEWGDRYYTKLAMAAAAERAPDVAILHLGRLPAFAQGGLIDPIRPDLLQQAGIGSQHFPDGLWRRSHYRDQLFAVPLDTHPFVMYYNVEICREAGLLDEQDRLRPLVGPEGVRAALRAAKEVTGSYGLLVESAGDGVVPWRLFWTLYRQLGGDLLTPDGTRSALDDAKLTRVLEFVQSLSRDGLASTGMDADAAIALFSSERAGFFWQGEWEVQTFIEAQIPFSMTPFPGVFGPPFAEADSHAFVLPHQPERTGNRHRMTYEFVASLLRNSTMWAEGGHIPAYLPVTNSDEYARMVPQSLYRSVIDDVQLDPEVWFAGSGSRLWTDMTAVVGPVMDGRMSVRQGAAEIRELVQQLLDTPNPVA
ncbi:extracellular solute-binding protein [Saccharopolyspora sp. K220]|uniref:extracellular solute-binding protein n=1 Tax=Saccharopolyspora soli TaxID=2926618 RepID=UPI001F5942FE|nr:extracellular solute-binding protein [Saccharopolyspora soli]MCI2421695.1 extracellular solute-binding protein [Saccharopolyspora soli]